MKKYVIALASIITFVCLVRTHPARCPEAPTPERPQPQAPAQPLQPNNFNDGRRDAITPEQAAEIAAHFGGRDNRDTGE